MWDMTARGYYISGLGASKAPGTEEIARIDTSFVVRLYGPHALGVNYLLTTRTAHYSSAELGSRHQEVGTITLVYNYLSDFHFGAVEWGRCERTMGRRRFWRITACALCRCSCLPRADLVERPPLD